MIQDSNQTLISGSDRAIEKYLWDPSQGKDWIVKVAFEEASGNLYAALSAGTLYSYSVEKPSARCLISHQAHDGNIALLCSLGPSTLASCAADGIKIWDVRANTMSSSMHISDSSYLSLAARDNLLAGGTELRAGDAPVRVWDWRNPLTTVNEFPDSHSDDVTYLEFHPTISHYLLSGSTDGCVNVYDMREHDEDDLLHQVINFLSVHTCHFLPDSRIGCLSHIETFAVHSLNNSNYEVVSERPPFDFGDMRAVLPECEYVIDVAKTGYAAYGANSSQSFSVCPFDPVREKFDPQQRIVFPGAHGEEVVRDYLPVRNTNSTITCGEDGLIKLWELPRPMPIYDFSPMVDDQTLMGEDANEPNSDKLDRERAKKEKKERKSKKRDKELADTKELSDKKHKGDKKSKKDKKAKKDIRFKPY